MIKQQHAMKLFFPMLDENLYVFTQIPYLEKFIGLDYAQHWL